MATFPRVRPLATLKPWQAPQSLEAISEDRKITPAIASGSIVQARDAAPTREPHRYAQLNGSLVFQVTTTSQLVLPAPQNFRNLLMMRNVGANVLYIEFGREASTDATIQLQPNQILLFDTVVPQDDVSAIAGAGSSTLSLSFSNINFLEPVT
jgi:hypothetical protein